MKPDWKPIATAPKDRRIMLAIANSQFISPGSWDSDGYAKNPIGYWRTWYHRTKTEWRTTSDAITHWDEMPSPPEV